MSTLVYKVYIEFSHFPDGVLALPRQQSSYQRHHQLLSTTPRDAYLCLALHKPSLLPTVGCTSEEAQSIFK